MKSATTILKIFLIGLILSSCGENETANSLKFKPKVDIYGVKCYDKLNEAQTASRQSGKPLFVIFDCLNNGCCRKSTDLVFKLLKRNDSIRNKYEVVYLQLDDKTRVESKNVLRIDGKRKKAKTIGDENEFLMIKMFDFVSSYYYVLLDDNLKIIKEPVEFFSDDGRIKNYLQ